MPGYISLQGISDPQIVRKTYPVPDIYFQPADGKPVRNFKSFESCKLHSGHPEKDTGSLYIIRFYSYTVIFQAFFRDILP